MDRLQELGRAVAILKVGHMHYGSHEQATGVSGDMMFVARRPLYCLHNAAHDADTSSE
jgi:hypothetical protein